MLAGLPSAIAPSATAARGSTLVVSAYEYSFQSADSVAAGVVTVRLVNHGKIGHQVALARLDDSSSLVRVMRSLVDNKAHTGGIRWSGGVESAIPGDSSETILALEPGRYVIVCAYDGDNGQAHMSLGMIRPLVVTAGVAKAAMALPATATTIRLSDYDVAVAGTLHSGRQLVRVENAGAHRHHLNLTRIRDGATLDEIMKWDGKSQPAPLEDMSGGVAVLEPGQASVISLNLVPGRYELACVMSNDSKSKPHYMLGMHDEIAVQ
ncbi:MAG: hypothetical protein JWO39_2072 [Gemmatimonadetes bacterium]|nr:hypothetical protein [Gemmatimonadota bacterium]